MPVCHYVPKVPRNAHLTKWPVCHKLGIKCQLGISRHSSHLVTNAIFLKEICIFFISQKKCKIFNSSNQEIRFFYVCKQCKRIHIAKPVHDTFCLISGVIQFVLRCHETRTLACVQLFYEGKCISWAYKVQRLDEWHWLKSTNLQKKFNWTNQVLQLATFDNLSAVQTPPTQPQNGWNTSNGMHQETSLINSINW